MISVTNFSLAYQGKKLLENLSFSAEKGELVAILGQNGVGKTSLFKAILGIHKEYQGSITIDGISVPSLSPKERAKKMAYVPQDTGAHFSFSVFDVVLMGCVSRLSLGASPSLEDQEMALGIMEELGILPLQEMPLPQLSGGERQLVFLARALVQNAEVVLLDEPTASLDLANQERVLQAISKLSQQGYTVLYTTHSPEQAYRNSHRILLLPRQGEAKLDTPQNLIQPETMSALYQIDMEVCSLHDDKIRVCFPKER